MTLGPHAKALALLDLCAAAGVSWCVNANGDPQASAAPPPELQAAVRALVGDTALDEAAWSKHAHAPSVEPPSQQEREKWRRASPGHKAMCSVIRAPTRAAKELLGLRIAHAKGLPVPFTVSLAAGSERNRSAAVVTTSKPTYEAAKKAGRVAFILRELDAMGLAVEMGRAGPSDFAGWLEAKRAGRQVTPELARVAEMPAYREGAQTGLTFGELFDALDVQVTAVEMHERAEEKPAAPSASAPSDASARAAADASGGAARNPSPTPAPVKEVSGW